MDIWNNLLQGFAVSFAPMNVAYCFIGVLVGTLIGSAIALNGISSYTTQSRLWDLFFRIAYIGYVLAMVIAILVLLRLIWRWIRGKPAGED